MKMEWTTYRQVTDTLGVRMRWECGYIGCMDAWHNVCTRRCCVQM